MLDHPVCTDRAVASAKDAARMQANGCYQRRMRQRKDVRHGRPRGEPADIDALPINGMRRDDIFDQCCQRRDIPTSFLSRLVVPFPASLRMSA